jgi:hypothetical protein
LGEASDGLDAGAAERAVQPDAASAIPTMET